MVNIAFEAFYQWFNSTPPLEVIGWFSGTFFVVMMAGWGGIGKLQRKWILERDSDEHGPRCQHRSFRNGRWVQCERRDGLHIHHIYPQRANKRWSPHKDPHRPENLITLCGDDHHNGPQGVHPDMSRALDRYRDGDKQAFEDTMKGRQALVDAGEVYWNTKWDWLYSKIVKRRNAIFSRGNPYPEKRRRKGWKPPK